jgi:hypothetical protein
MGLRRGKVQSISMGFYILPRADDKRSINVLREKIRTKKKRRGKYLSSTMYLVLDSGAYVIRKGEKSL